MDQLSQKNKIWTWLAVVDLLILNLGVGYLLYKAQSPSSLSPTSITPPLVQNVDECGPDCQAYIDSKILKSTPKPTPIPTPTPRSAAASPRAKVRTTSYVPIPSSGSTALNDWTNLPGTDFYFNPANYPGLVEARFEANIHLTNGNGTAYVRLYDVTHSIGVQGSEAHSDLQVSTAVDSGWVNFWSGNNLIRVQAKSLTADTAVFDGGRLRITVEN